MASAGGQRRTFVDSLGDVALDAVALALHGQRPHVAVRIERIPTFTWEKDSPSASTRSSWRSGVTTMRVSDEQT